MMGLTPGLLGSGGSIFAVFLVILATFIIVRELPKALEPKESNSEIVKGIES